MSVFLPKEMSVFLLKEMSKTQIKTLALAAVVAMGFAFFIGSPAIAQQGGIQNKIDELEQKIDDNTEAIAAEEAARAAADAALDSRLSSLETATSEVSVACPGESITNALAEATPGTPLVITLQGTCNENVVITSNDITLQGETPSDGISGGGITIDGAQRVVIDNVTVDNAPRDGIVATNGAAVTISNATIENSTRNGVTVLLGATAQINGNTLSGNGAYAVIVDEAGSARLRNNTITTTYIPGAIGVYRNASLRLFGGNTVTNTSGAGNAIAIEAFHVSNVRQGDIGDRGPDVLTANRVISVGNLSTVDLRAFEADGNVVIFLQSNLRMRNGVYNGDVSATGAFSVAEKRTSVTGINTCTGNCSGF